MDVVVEPRKSPQPAGTSRLSGGEIQFSHGESSLGLVLVARKTRGICAVLLGDDFDALLQNVQERFPGSTLVEGGPDLDALADEISSFIESPAQRLDVPIDLRGTDFQHLVWRALQEIPAGETASYTEIAHRIGRPRAVRAVAQACAANPLAILVPCHRVVRSDGSLSGYRWGIERKRALLDREATARA